MKLITQVVLTLSLVAACGGPAPSREPTSTTATTTPARSGLPTFSAPPSASTQPTGSSASPLPFGHAQLPPGRYTKSGFVPAVEFTVGAGWIGQQSLPGFFDIERDPTSRDVIAVQFANLNAPSLGALVDQVTNQPNTKVIDQGDVTIDGRAGFYATVETTDPADSGPPIFRPVLSVGAGPISIASGRRLQINLVEVTNGMLAVLIGGSIAKWDDTLSIAQPVVDSVTIRD